ncbi:DNA polymerase III subunit gamma/tau [Porticoccus sp. W117]|uniref:DNA polymerase III subunit gamma/tau n=1 Tax=Porticoccus sp. W117 TaxID=3054777 RepID=UPI00259701A3|nr:DNA polymerase III subunit gamma/tau [Porticoccus sp. W117]MDM3871152.1 DNA polymerase III subunit gamma/tau [Porticoccus sp. W117]
MSYQVLARKWRPRIFREMAGQEHVLQALINALDNERLHHAYLFTGTRGVGKTTIARILAKCLNCEQGVSSTPCGECGACVEIAEGRFVDLIEVDAASRTKVEDTRELLENVQYAPTRGRFKVYLIDEVHMLSTHSFNALLKTLEEPPPHVKFLLATTDPQKLPVTILSRCLQFNLKNLSPERISEHLKFVLGEESVPFEDAALWQLARSADGSMRDALSLTDQAIAHGGGTVAEAEVNAMLGTIDRSWVMELCNAIADDDGDQALAVVARMAEQGPDYNAVLADMLGFWHRVAIAQTVPEALDNRHGDYQQVTEVAQRMERETVQLLYQIALLGRRDLTLSPDPRSGFEMALLRQLAFKPGSSEMRPPAQQQTGEEPPVKKPLSPTPDIEPEPVELPAEPVEQLAQEQSPGSSIPAEPIPHSQEVESVQESSQLTTVESEPEPAAGGELTGEWIDICQRLKLGGVLGNTAANLVVTAREGNNFQFILDEEYSSLYEEGQQQRLADALQQHCGSPCRVVIKVGAVTGDTPRKHSERLRAERMAAAVQTMRDDPLVKDLTEQLNGRLLEDTVQPLD